MSNIPDAKLASLRARRDRELIAIIGSTVERGVHALRRDAGEGGAEAREKAARAHAEATKLLRLVYHLSEPERRWFDMRLAELQPALSETERAQAPRARTAGR